MSAEDFGAWVPGPRCMRPATGRGRLDGVRLAVKDLLDVAGCPTGGGNPDWAAGRAPAAGDAPCVARLRAAGAAVVGKTVTDELAFSLEGENAHHGTPRNPRAPGYLPGGSSSGSAVAVAAGLADLALGTDTGGSVRVPAAFCGVWGMRPTHGRIALDGVLPFAPSYDTVGWMAGSAALLAAAGEVLLARSVPALGGTLRVRIAADAWALADAPVAEALRVAAARLGAQGEVRAFGGPWQPWLDAYAALQGLEIQASLGAWIRARRPAFGPTIAPRFESALRLSAADGEAWRPWREAAAQRLQASLGRDEAWLLPAAPVGGLALEADAATRNAFYAHALALGSIAGHAGLPQVVLPLPPDGGPPRAVSLLGARGNDERLLAMAQAWERAWD